MEERNKKKLKPSVPKEEDEKLLALFNAIAGKRPAKEKREENKEKK